GTRREPVEDRPRAVHQPHRSLRPLLALRGPGLDFPVPGTVSALIGFMSHHPSTSTPAAADAGHHADHIGHHIRRYLYVFWALIAGTAFTVWASYIHFGSHEINIVVALVIACTKAFLVGGYFMHLVSERK